MSKFNNILATCDISFWCTNFRRGTYFGVQISCGGIYFGSINFLKGYKFPEGVQISWRGTNFLEGYIFGWYKFHLTNFQQVYIFSGYNYGPAQNSVSCCDTKLHFGATTTQNTFRSCSSHSSNALGLVCSCCIVITPPSHRYTRAVRSYPWTEYHASTGSSWRDRKAIRTHFESCCHFA